jgi:hypothetical protein
MILNLGNFFFILTICVLGCALATHILFGRQIASFNQIGPSTMAIINYLAGNSAQELLGADPVMGRVMYIILLGVILIVLLNLLIAVLNSSYAEVEKQATTAWTREQAEILVDNLDKFEKFSSVARNTFFKRSHVNEHLYKLREPKNLLDGINVIVEKYVSYRKYNQMPQDMQVEGGKTTIAGQLEQLDNTLQFTRSNMEKRFIKQSNYMGEKFGEINFTIQTLGGSSESHASTLVDIISQIKRLDAEVKKIRFITMLSKQLHTAKGIPNKALANLISRQKNKQTATTQGKEEKPNEDTGTEENQPDDTSNEQTNYHDVLALLDDDEAEPPVQRRKKLRGPGSFMEGTASSKARLRQRFIN